MTDSRLPLYNRTLAWMELVYGPILSSSIPLERVIMGGLTHGFDDFTQSWGACQQRTIPRHLDLIRAQLDYLKSHSIRHLFIYTWDDWIEGSQVEPDVVNGTRILLLIRQAAASFYNEAQVIDGDVKLVSRWTNYPQLRNCTQINVTSVPSINLTCPTKKKQSNVSYSCPISIILAELFFLLYDM